MRKAQDASRTRFNSTAALVGWKVRLLLAALGVALLSGIWFPPLGGTAHSQNAPVQRGTTSPEINIASRGAAAGQVMRLNGVTAKNGILAFDSLVTYDQSYPIIFNMNNEQAEAWERSLGFVSQRNIFNQIVKAEYEYLAAPYEGKSAAQLKRMNKPRGHTDIYEKYLRAGVIKIQPEARGEGTYTSALTIGGYQPIINEQGYFIVGNTIYQIKEDRIKELEGLDFSRLPALDKAAADDPANKIKVYSVVANSSATPSTAASNCSYPRTTNWITSGNRRGMTTVNFSKTYWNPYPHSKVTINYNVNVKSQKKNVWGNWVYPPCPNECWISFTWTTVFEYMSKTTLGYAGYSLSPRSYSYPNPNCINNFNISLNPITSTNVPYPSNFTFTAPSGLAFLDVSFQNALWHASVPGGSSGINCDVGCP